MKTTKKALIDEIINNVRNDRVRLESFWEELSKVENLDKIEVGEILAKLSAEMTRSNSQLLEIEKMRNRHDGKENHDVEKLQGDDVTDAFDAIGQVFAKEDDDIN